VARLQSFYVDNFDLPIVEEIKDEWVVLQAGSIELALHLVGEHYRKAAVAIRGDHDNKRPSPPHNAHTTTKLVFAIETNLAEHREKLLAAGIYVGALKRYDGFPYELYDGHDPEGNVFQVMRFDEI